MESMIKDFFCNRALFIHCMVHSLNLGVKDAIQGIRVIKDAIDNCHETNKLVKGSPKKENIFKGIQLDDESDIKKNKLRTMCPTRFTVRGDAMDAILKNYSEIQQSLDEYYDQEKNTETKARIAGVALQHSMKSLTFCLAHIWEYLSSVILTISVEHFRANTCQLCKEKKLQDL